MKKNVTQRTSMRKSNKTEIEKKRKSRRKRIALFNSIFFLSIGFLLVVFAFVFSRGILDVLGYLVSSILMFVFAWFSFKVYKEY